MARNDPPYRFSTQRSTARRRKVAWELTFEQWWDVWEKSGQWENRGCRKGKYVMGRFGDKGPYAVGNVYIREHSENSRDGITNWPAKKKAREDREAAERTNGSTADEGPRTLPSSPDCTCGKEVEDSEAYIENAARIFLENGRRYGQPQPDALSHIVGISSRKSSKQSNAIVSIAESNKNPDGEREIGLSLIEKMGEVVNLLKRLFEGNYRTPNNNSKERPRATNRNV